MWSPCQQIFAEPAALLICQKWKHNAGNPGLDVHGLMSRLLPHLPVPEQQQALCAADEHTKGELVGLESALTCPHAFCGHPASPRALSGVWKPAAGCHEIEWWWQCCRL